MINKSVDYCVCSTDARNYNKIDVTLPCPNTEYSKMIVTTFTTKCEIMVLTENDFIRLQFPDLEEDKKIIEYHIKDNYKQIDITKQYCLVIKSSNRRKK